MILVRCPCGRKFKTSEARIKQGRGRYCSRECMYKWRKRPTGLKYNLKKDNPTWFKKGHLPWNRGTKGVMTAWNKGLRGILKANSGSFKKGEVSNENNLRWRGDFVGYGGLHTWISRNYGKASKCENKGRSILGFECNGKSNNYDWAFMGKGDYKRDKKLFVELCHSCHLRYDYKMIKSGEINRKRIAQGGDKE